MRVTLALLLTALFACPAFTQTVNILYSQTSPQARYAAAAIEKVLAKQHYTQKKIKPDFLIKLTINPSRHGNEAFSITRQKQTITIEGGDERGMIYGTLSVAEEVRNGTRLENIKPRSEQTNYSLRAVKFDLPWDTYRHSACARFAHETCKDVNYWKAFLGYDGGKPPQFSFSMEPASLHVHD